MDGYFNNIENIQDTFSYCTALVSVTNLPSATKSVGWCFDGCSKLQTVTAYNLAPTTNASAMFKGCSSLTTIIGLDTWNMSGCTTCYSMFNGTSNLTTLPGSETWVLSSCQNTQGMFGNSGITSLNVTNWDMSKCRAMYINYHNKKNNLSEIIGMENWNVSTCTDFREFLNHCISLSEFEIFSPINYNISFNLCPLTVDTLVKILNALGEVSETQTLKIGEANLAKLTDEQIAIATNKGWSVV